MAHAKLSPSASHRWMNCPGSVALIGEEGSVGGQAAMMGTAAHKVIETMIINGHHDAREYAGFAVLVKQAGDEETELYPPDQPALPNGPREGWFMFMVDEKMVDGCQVTIDEVDRIRAVEYDDQCETFSEHYLDMSWLDDRLGGTADVTIVQPFNWAHLVDHKNGYLLVEAKDNDQLKQYGVGVLHEHPDVDGVTVTICQPNAPHIEGVVRSDSFTRDELKLYEIQMKQKADETSNPNAIRRVGDWCTFCSAKTRCPEYIATVEEEAKMEFEDEPSPIALPQSTPQLIQMAKWIPYFQALCRQVLGDIQRELENGNEVEGWKLVRGKARRKWANPAELQRRMTAASEELGEEEDFIGIMDELLWEIPQLKSPAQMEKLGVGREQRKLVKKLVQEMAYMPEGRLTVAEVFDPRPVATPSQDAQDEFSEDEEDF